MPLRYTASGDTAGPLDLAERARRYVAKMPPAISGQHGHDQTFAVACALIQGFGLPRAAAEPLLREYNARCQPPWSARELAHKLDSAVYAEPPTDGRGHLARNAGSLPPGTAAASPRPCVAGSAITDATQLELFLRSSFEPDEILSLAPGALPPDSDRAIPEHAGVNTFTRDEWLARAAERGGIARVFSSRHGLFIRINPVRPGAAGTDADVAVLRHVLVESDALPKPDQEQILRASGLPISALIDSAGASIHAWVRVDATTREEYHTRREKVWAALPGFAIDTANKNPSRFSRCPGGLRGDSVQRLLAVNLGAASYTDWEAEHEDAREVVTASSFCAEDEPDPPQLIDGLLYRGAKMIIAGPSKSRKTWNLTDLAISVSLGQPWCGFTTRAASVLYVNLEIARFSYRKRIRFICTARGFAPASLTRFHIWNRRGRDNEIIQLAERLRRQALRCAADIVIIDPIYKTYGDREENSNTEMAQVLNELERLAHATGAAVLVAAHFPKGNLTGRDAIDRVAGASVFGRDPDALLIMTPHEAPDAYTVTTILRDLPPQPEFVIQWCTHHFARIVANPLAMQGRQGKRADVPSFIPGSYRTLFSDMPPLANAKDPAKSPVLHHIAEKLRAAGKDPAKAFSVFHVIRQPEREILTYSRATQTWQGVNYVAST